MNLNTQNEENKPGMSEQQKQTIKKYIVFAAMGLICAGCMYLIFSPSSDEKAKTEVLQGFNAEIPMPKDEIIIGDKRDAYEQEQMKQKQEERMRSLQDFSALLGETNASNTDDLSLLSDAPTKRTGGGNVSQNRTQSSQNYSQTPMQSSVQAYQDMNRTLGNFYEKPREDPEKERLRNEMEELKTQLGETDNRKNTMDEQLELMEKSLQMVSKYMPATGSIGTMGTMGTTVNTAELVPAANTSVSEKAAVVAVDRVQERTVSALLPEMSHAEFIQTYSQPRNMSFRTISDVTNTGTKNTVSACVHNGQTVMDGQNVRLRLLEPVYVGNVVIPRNTTITGMAKIQGERLGITVMSLEHAGTVIPVEMRVYDLDGQQGIFIPDMAELSALKEIVANMGTSVGTSITLSNEPGKQFAADMGRGAIQGVSQFTAKKLREVKVHLKADYRIYLLVNK